MRRREFIGLLGGAAGGLICANVFAAQKAPIARIGFLAIFPPPNTWLQYDLRALGWRDGENLQIEIRSSNGEIAGLPSHRERRGCRRVLFRGGYFPSAT